jgi:hypothetical protein
MIVNGFCKEVFNELPMEFAVEAQSCSASASRAPSAEPLRSAPAQPAGKVAAQRPTGPLRVTGRHEQAAQSRWSHMLSDKGLKANVDDKEILKGLDLEWARRGARHHGPERLRQEHPRARAVGPRGLRGHRRQRRFDGEDLLELEPRSARAWGCSWRFSIRWSSPASTTPTS